MSEPGDVLNLPDFRNELSQIGARAALTALREESEGTWWRYRTERVVRNLTAASTEMEREDLHDGQTGKMLTVARGWEHLAELGEHVHPSTARINAALAYEWAGYQANAACLARIAVHESRWTTDPSFDGLVSAFLQRLFVRVRALEPQLTERPNSELLRTMEELDRRAAYALTAMALSRMSSYFLTGEPQHVESSMRSLDLALKGLAQAGDAVAYNTVTGLRNVAPVMVSRSTWKQLAAKHDSPRWARYLRILARGLGDDILGSRSISELWPSQLAAIESGLLESGQSLAVRMPTSAGKTRVAELAIVHSLVSQPGSKCVYVAPYRALANEIEQSFANLFHDLGYGASTIPGGYDLDEMSEDLVTDGDVLVLTPEKLDLLFRLQSNLLDQVALIVIDEGHIVEDRQRGPKFELLISRLRRRIPKARFLMMSAVVPDATLQHFADWLGAGSGSTVTTEWRPSRLKHGCLDWDGQRGTLRYEVADVDEGGLEFVPSLVTQAEFKHVATDTGRVRRPKFPSKSNKGDVAAEVAYRFAPLGPVLVFAMQTNWAESTAAALGRRINLAELSGQTVPHEFRIRKTGRAFAVAAEWLGEEHPVTDLLSRGIAFHHGRLPSAVRDAIEACFRERRLAVLVATSTLAQGVNLPVRTVVIHSCRSREEDESTRILSAREYWNIAGRAGRAGSETEGTVVHIASTRQDVNDFKAYAKGRTNVERVESALYRMLKELVAARISTQEASRQLDADLLALLVEEADGALDDEELAETLSSSLFHIQAMEAETDVEPLIEVMTSTARQISIDVPDLDRRRLFASTGLCSPSCLAIADHVEANTARIERTFAVEANDIEPLLDLVLDGLVEVSEMEPRAAVSVDTRELLTAWLGGESVKAICDDQGVNDPRQVTEFIEDAFSYRLPWGISSYIRLAAALTRIPVASRLAANLAAIVKYGVPSPEAAWAMSAGVASRHAARAVAGEYHRTASPGSVAAFRRWLGRLDPELMAERLELVGAELESIARAILKSQPNDYLANLDEGGELLPLRASCRTVRAAVDSGLVYSVASGDELQVSRDRDSRLNRNAVQLLKGNATVGYLQADAARALGPELDSGLEVLAEVVDVSVRPGDSIDVIVEIREHVPS